MECFLLGSGGMMPMPRRRLTSVAIRRNGRIALFDCGEGTQVPYKEQRLGLRNLDIIAITHMHADHVLGLPGMLMLRAQMPDPPPLTLLGPPGLARFVQNVRRDLGMFINYAIQTTEWTPQSGEVAFGADDFRIRWLPLDHGVPCFGYRFEEFDLPGRFDVATAKTLNIPQGPLWGQLQAGNPVVLDDGRRIQPEEVLGPARPGRRIGYATDTRPTKTLERIVEAADLAFVESMFAPEEATDAEEKKHMTVVEATKAAARARVKKLILVHISPRYEGAAVKRLGSVAREHHNNVRVGRDGDVFELPVPP